MKHLNEHNETQYLKEAVYFLKQESKNIPFDTENIILEMQNNIHVKKVNERNDPFQKVVPETPGQLTYSPSMHQGGCQGTRSISFKNENFIYTSDNLNTDTPTQLRQWPVQLHLVNPAAPYFKSSDLLIAADCVAYSLGDFHNKYLKNKTLAIACPKLDSELENYIQKIKLLIDDAKVNTIQVLIMEVPCCSGLLKIVKTAADLALRKVPVKLSVVGIKGAVVKEEWI